MPNRGAHRFATLDSEAQIAQSIAIVIKINVIPLQIAMSNTGGMKSKQGVQKVVGHALELRKGKLVLSDGRRFGKNLVRNHFDMRHYVLVRNFMN